MDGRVTGVIGMGLNWIGNWEVKERKAGPFCLNFVIIKLSTMMKKQKQKLEINMK
jgi:hypothetical protein